MIQIKLAYTYYAKNFIFTHFNTVTLFFQFMTNVAIFPFLFIFMEVAI